MAYIDWKPEFSVGITSIDNQHRKLVDMINQLFAAMSEGKGQTALEKVLADLAVYCSVHFGTEEKLFIQYGYPETAEHKAIHQKLTTRVAQLQKDVKSGKEHMTLGVANFLKDWLVKHIQQTDKRYSEFLISKGAK
jgi:hemerythrin-like metal-binding protein